MIFGPKYLTSTWAMWHCSIRCRCTVVIEALSQCQRSWGISPDPYINCDTAAKTVDSSHVASVYSYLWLASTVGFAKLVGCISWTGLIGCKGGVGLGCWRLRGRRTQTVPIYWCPNSSKAHISSSPYSYTALEYWISQTVEKIDQALRLSLSWCTAAGRKDRKIHRTGWVLVGDSWLFLSSDLKGYRKNTCSSLEKT